jgi:hypothetical protein
LKDSDDDALEALWKKEYSLAELVATDQFKSYDELKTRLSYVLGNKKVTQDAETVDEDSDRGEAEQLVTTATANTPSSTDDDEALSYFAKLAAE